MPSCLGKFFALLSLFCLDMKRSREHECLGNYSKCNLIFLRHFLRCIDHVAWLSVFVSW